jgi:hypothetical protein
MEGLGGGSVGRSPGSAVVEPQGEAAIGYRVGVVVLFALTILLGAALLFLVEPMAAKSVLPLLGGSPAVWNAAMVFFQGALLGGYLGAHLLGRAGRRMQVAGYALALAAPVAASVVAHRLIVDVPEGWTSPRGVPVIWTLGLLAVMVGGPFVALAAAGPLLQRWFAGTGHAAARDPYFLYVASNAGSMAGLLAYPLAVEPLLPLTEQRWAWSAGFGGFAILAAACGVVFQMRAGRSAADTAAPLSAAPLVPWRTRLLWVVLALVPSSLMLGVTQYLSTDIAAVPLLWVLPLAVYLLTFIIAFARPPLVRSLDLEGVVPIVVAALVVAFMIRGFHLPAAALFALHLLGLLVIALWCHARLAESRPAAERLTEFYLWVALGGVLGGAFNALVAPEVFPLVVEYPLMLAAACVLRVRPADARRDLRDWSGTVLDLSAAAAVGALASTLDPLLKRPPMEDWLKAIAGLLRMGKDGDGTLRLAVSVGVPVLLLYLTKKRPMRFALAATAVLAAAFVQVDPRARLLHVERTFFGVYRVERNLWQTWLTHGTTLHGLQWRDPLKRGTPLSYYHPDGPAGGVFKTYGPTQGNRVGLVGMGTGALAAFAAPGQRYTFHEIDPAVVRLAENPAYFTYLSDCRERGAAWDVVLGDGRLTMAAVPEGAYGIIVLDAFSSDSIPVHLLTREAMALYLRKVRPGGVLAYHVSNQYLRLAPVVGREAADLGAAALVWEDDATVEEMTTTGRYGSVWVAVARSTDDLKGLAADGRWRAVRVGPGTPLWTDDYSNILGVIGKKE